MLKWFRQGPSPHQTALAMIGAKPGDRVLVAGQPDPALVGEVARITGLNGQTAVACAASRRTAFETAAGEAGALIDLLDVADGDASIVPPGATAIDVAILVVDLATMPLDARLTATRDSLAVLRPGGRLIVIDGTRRAGLFGGRATPPMPADAVVPLLTSVGAAAARALGVEGAVTYYEARRAR